MIIVITVVMLLTFIPLAIFTQAVQQLPLARHDQDHESALAAAEAGVDDYLNHLNQNSNYWTYNATQPAARRQPGVHELGAGAGPERQRRDVPLHARHDEDARRPARSTSRRRGKSRNVIRTVKVGLRRQGFLDFLYMTDYEIVDPALSGDPTVVRVPRVGVERAPRRPATGPTRRAAASCTGPTPPSLNGPVHTNDGLYVCGSAALQRRHRHVLQLADEPERRRQHAVRRAGHGAQPAQLRERAGVRARNNDPASGADLPFPPANTVDPHAGRRHARRHRLPLHRPDDDHAAQLRQRRPDGRDEPGTTKLDERGLRPGHQLEPARQRRDLRADRAELARRIRTTRRASARRATATSSVSGTLAGQLTIASQNDIIINGNLVYHQYPGGTDVLGLVANNDVDIYHPVSGSG